MSVTETGRRAHGVNVISRHAILDAGMRHPDAESALTAWYKAARQARWESLHEVQAVLPLRPHDYRIQDRIQIVASGLLAAPGSHAARVRAGLPSNCQVDECGSGCVKSCPEIWRSEVASVRQKIVFTRKNPEKLRAEGLEDFHALE
jgi:hypothetical protein